MVLIRKLQSEDVDEASRVLCDVMRDSWERYEKDCYPKHALEFDISINSPEHLREKLVNPQKLLFVAEENEKIVGLAFGEIVGESGLARLGWIGVLPEHQQQGIGKALLNKFIEHCKQKVCHKSH